MKVLFLFLDGVGLGENNSEINPFARASLPNLDKLLGGYKLVNKGLISNDEPILSMTQTTLASLLALDACLGIDGLPQSATGQAALFTGENVPALLGSHEGPKPTPAIMELIERGTLLTRLQQRGRDASFTNAFPPRYFEAIDAGYRIPGVIALCVKQAGIRLNTHVELFEGKAISADFTGVGWRDHLGYPETPILTFHQAGRRLSELSANTDLTIFEYWLTDFAGHHRDMQAACMLLQALDAILGSLIEVWDGDNGLILLTSDHGNLEDLSTRHHTRNKVPLLLIGSPMLREAFVNQMQISRAARTGFDLTNIAPAILKFIS